MNPNRPDTYYNLGNAYVNKENYKDAIKSFKKCIELDGSNSQAIYNLGKFVY